MITNWEHSEADGIKIDGEWLTEVQLIERCQRAESLIAELEQEIADAYESLNDLGAPDSKWLDGTPTDLSFRICEYASTPVEATDDSKRLDIIRNAYRNETASKVVIELTPEQFRAALQEGE